MVELRNMKLYVHYNNDIKVLNGIIKITLTCTEPAQSSQTSNNDWLSVTLIIFHKGA